MLVGLKMGLASWLVVLSRSEWAKGHGKRFVFLLPQVQEKYEVT